MEFDPQPLTAWKGALFHASMYQMHGVGLSSHFLGSIAQVSDLEGVATTRLGEVWLQQQLGDYFSIRAGQLGVDTDFLLSPLYGLGVGAAFGWPTIAASNLPNGGPAYPFVSPGVRVKFTPNDKLTFLAAIFDGDPAGPGTNNPQLRNRYGTNFRLSDPPLLIGEAQWNYSVDWPGTVRIGAWKHFGKFADQRWGYDSLLLSDPNGVGKPFMRRQNSGLYGVIDQQVHQKDGKKDAGIFLFSRASVSPSDRNLIDFYVDGGVSFQGMTPGRTDDQFGVLASFARVSRQARLADFDVNFFNGTFAPVRNYEAILEATYAINVTNGVVLQPNIQYVIHPGGGAVDPNDPFGLRAIRNALVVGIRTTIQY
jgi:porin